ncbi:translation initiation factor IF-3 [Candidatus Collierbacteria bacterium]|nr:translation initiation factor IF-3 [Candidatus Collierbacteria bacterium]
MIDEKGTQIGVMTKAEALKKAQEMDLDLVLVAPSAKPAVAKIIDFSKFQFQQEKKEQTSRKKNKSQELKELRLTPFMAENDLNVRLERARKFLKGGDKVRLVVYFKGRQITKKQFGYDILQQCKDSLAECGTPETEAKLRGKNLEVVFKPIKSNEKTKTQDQIIA